MLKKLSQFPDPMIEEYSKRVNKKIKKILPLIPFGNPNDSKDNLRNKLKFTVMKRIYDLCGFNKADKRE